MGFQFKGNMHDRRVNVDPRESHSAHTRILDVTSVNPSKILSTICSRRRKQRVGKNNENKGENLSARLHEEQKNAKKEREVRGEVDIGWRGDLDVLYEF